MIICSVQNVSKTYGGNQIFENISFEINEGERIGIVGTNGSGKTTILKLIAKVEHSDSGVIHIRKGLKVGYLAQISSFQKGIMVEEVLGKAFEDIRQIEKRMKELEIKMAEENDETKLKKMLEEYGVIQEKFSRSGGYEIDSEITKIVNGLGISKLLKQDFNLLSGGEQTKVSLGMMLLTKPDLLLLDEPTNHLDIFAVEWLEQFLKQYDGTIITISHDRYFLDNVVSKVFDLEAGELDIYSGNYTTFVKEKEERLLTEFTKYQEQQKKIKKMKEAIKRLREWANRANPPSEGLHKRAASMEKALERMEKLKKPVINRKKINLSFAMNDRSGNEVALFESVSKTFSEAALFQDVDLSVRFGERVALIGQNGTGKTTLIRMLLDEETPDQGIVKLGSNVKIGYLSQNVKNENGEDIVVEAFRNQVSVTEEKARHILAKFLFYGHSVFKKVNNLSGGEKIRLKLAQLMHSDINLLILDEPTNHLDIDSKEVFEDALEDFNGTIISVSHDRYFLNKLFNITYWIENRGLIRYEGNYDEAKQKRNQTLSMRKPSLPLDKKEKPEKKSSNNSKREKPKIDLLNIEEEIEKKEEEIYQLEKLMFAENDIEALQDLQKKKEEIENFRDQLYHQLEQSVEETGD